MINKNRIKISDLTDCKAGPEVLDLREIVKRKEKEKNQVLKKEAIDLRDQEARSRKQEVNISEKEVKVRIEEGNHW